MFQISRQALYEQVWSEPMTKLAKQYGLSDVGLAKTCKRHNIPIPGRGYWAKKLSDKARTPQQPLLSKLPEDEEFLETIYIQQSPVYEQDDNDENNEMIEAEKLEQNKIIVHGYLDSPHSIVARSEKSLRSAKPEGKGLYAPKARDCLDIRVGKDNIDRVLRIMDSLIKALESRGFAIIFDKKEKGPLAVSVNGETLDFSLEEVVKCQEYEPNSEEKKKIEKRQLSRYSLPRYAYTPTGKLALKINYMSHSHHRLTWADAKVQRVENCLNKFIIGLIQAAAYKKADREKREQREREWEEERQRRVEKKRLYQEEQARVEALENDAENWHKSQRISAYINAVRKDTIEKDGEILSGSELDKWLIWANQQADRLDPLVESSPSILDEPEPSDFYWLYM